jgi:hypothetical protein
MPSPILYQAPGAFVSHLAKIGYKKQRPATTDDEFEIHWLDITPLKLNTSFFTPLLISKRLSGFKTVNSDQLRDLFPELDKTAKSLKSEIVILIVGGKLISIDESLREDLGLIGVAVVDRPTIEGVLATTDADERAKLISTALVQFLGREALSPYVSGRPAIGGRFFARSSLVKQMVPGSGNYTIMGNRRIGKTSLLKEIRERLKLNNVSTAEVYGATCKTTEDVVYKILTELGRFRDIDRCLQRPKTLVSSIHTAVEHEKRSIALFIDELDKILDFDAKQGWEVLDILREAVEGHPSCRVFFAGFRKVMAVKQSLSAPLFNFTTPIELPLFTRQETVEMVTKPLDRLGIKVGTDLPETIYQETTGHPELIQLHCKIIIQFLKDHNRIPTGADLFTHVFEDAEYKQKVLGTFLANTNAHEELLCYLLIADSENAANPTEYEFGHQDVNRVLKEQGITLQLGDIHGVIHNLKVSGIITPVIGAHERFRFSAPQLVNYVAGLDLAFCIEKALERARDAAGEAGVWTEPPEEPKSVILT